MEPFYVRQACVIGADHVKRAFFEQCSAEAKKEGAHLFRCSIHPDDESMLLVEAWRERHVSDQGPQRWSLRAAG